VGCWVTLLLLHNLFPSYVYCRRLFQSPQHTVQLSSGLRTTSECGCSRLPKQDQDMIKPRKDHNIKHDRHRQLKHLLVSGNTKVDRKVTRPPRAPITHVDYSQKGWRAFTNWNKNRYVLLTELKEYNLNNPQLRSLSGRPTLGIRSPGFARIPLGGNTQARPSDSDIRGRLQSFSAHNQMLLSTTVLYLGMFLGVLVICPWPGNGESYGSNGEPCAGRNPSNFSNRVSN